MRDQTLAVLSREWIDGTTERQTNSPAGSEFDAQVIAAPELSHTPTMYSDCCDTSGCSTQQCTTLCGPIGTTGVCGC